VEIALLNGFWEVFDIGAMGSINGFWGMKLTNHNGDILGIQ
jgi:hypothetical protein